MNGCLGPFKSARTAFVTLVFALVDVLAPVQPVAAQTGGDELPDLALAAGRVKIANIVRLYYLSPVLTTVEHASAADPKLIALLGRLRLTVSNDATFYPSAWAEQGPAGSAPISIDAAYFWTKKELFWLAALRSLVHRPSSQTIQSTFARYRVFCRETRQLQLPAPWVSLGTTIENRRFGDINKALAGLSQMEQEAVDRESGRIGRQFMAFILLHEIAHHYLGHVAKKVTSEDARGLELSADEWAARLAASIGFSLADVRTMFRLEAMAEAERLATGYAVPPTHPHWSTRASRLDWLLPQIPVSHPDVIRLSGVRPIETHEGVQYVNIEIEFPRDPVASGTTMSSLSTGDRYGDLDGVSHRRGAMTYYLWFREYGVGGPRYVVGIEDALSHEPRAVWQTISVGQTAPPSISTFSLRPDYARDPVTALVGQRSLHSLKWRVTEALRQAGAAGGLQTDALNTFLTMEHELEGTLSAWVRGDMQESDFDAQRDQLIRARWDRLRRILGDALFDRFEKAYIALLHD